MLNASTFNLTQEESQIWGGNNYYALIVFPVNFTENMVNLNQQINLTVYLDGSNPQIVPFHHGSNIQYDD